MIQKKKTAIVVGAGVGGVATAARLAKAGFHVTVLEKNAFTGGRCSLIYQDGHRFDQGPSLLLLPKLFQETFTDLGTSLEKEGVKLLKCTPNYLIRFADGDKFELSTDTSVMKREIEKYEGVDGFDRYLSWLSEAHAHYEISVAQVLHRNFTTIFNLLRWDFIKELLRLHPFESIYSRASRYFWTERLRRVFTFGSMYMGMSPFDAPGTYSLLQYTELAEGIWYPIGGFHAVVEALVRVGERMGVNYRLNAPVVSVIESEKGKIATGVRLVTGEELRADVVIINADLVYAYNNLFSSSAHSPASVPKSQAPSSYASLLTRKEGSCSSISFYWALSQKVPQLSTHNIFLADAYKESFDAIFKRQSIPKDPSFYVNVPSRIDPSAAPDGCDSIVVLVPVGHLLKSKTTPDAKVSSPFSPETSADPSQMNNMTQNWVNIVASARKQIISTIESRTGCPLLSPLIKHEIINTPQSWESTFNLDKGSILGLSHSFFNVLAFRPGIKHKGGGMRRRKGLTNVYFVGASTHPGTGVPIVLAGAKMTCQVVLKEMRTEIPWGDWRRDLSDVGRLNKIDRIESSGIRAYIQGGVLTIFVLIIGLSYQRYY